MKKPNPKHKPSNLINSVLLRKFCFLSVVILVFMDVPVTAQVKWTLLLDGLVLKDDKKLEGATVFLYCDSIEVQRITTHSDGKFSFLLEPGHEYLIIYTKEGYVSKSLYMNTKGVPDGAVGDGGQFSVSPEINLFEMMEGLNVDILAYPVGKLYYDTISKNFEWDRAELMSRQGKINQLLNDLEERRAEKADNTSTIPVMKLE